MWSGWLYGRPMWSPETCRGVDHDLECIMNISTMCNGCQDGLGKDHDGSDASLDAVRDILLNESHVPRNPLGIMGCDIRYNSKAIKMLAEVLVYGKCATDGRTQQWLRAAEGTDWADFNDVLRSIGIEFAEKLTGATSPDFTARCAYHVHPPGSACGAAGGGEMSSGQCMLQNRLVDVH
jgi:hypothetical protein